ncbi:MAG: SDR family NAD(P)-dependent oxidoreductase [Alphaproteobacteria bacterium]
MTSPHPAIQQGHTAIVTGGASGIGLAVAQKLAGFGMTILLADRDEEALARAASTIDGAVTHKTDVTNADDWAALKQKAGGLPPVSVLINNAGASINPGHTWEKADLWQRQMAVNFRGIVNGVQAFVGDMVASDRPGLVVNTGSKQGITLPPGNYAYNVSKAAVLAFTQCLAHDLRETVGTRVTAHLLVPGFTYSGMISQFLDTKPDGAWTCEQVADFLIDALAADDFFVLCPDNDVPRPVDEKRIQWTVDDIIQNRPALSRWHPDYAEAFEAFMQG